jgi:formylglycine-generating enzyme required for sulfatase activity
VVHSWFLALAGGASAAAMAATLVSLLPLPSAPRASGATGPSLIELRPGTFRYRASGEFTRDGKPTAAPLVSVRIEFPLAIMRHQVTAADYRRCVAAGACQPNNLENVPDDHPAVKASWRDAQAYASWLSRETGSRFRLPSDEEWAYAAGELLADDALPEAVDVGDPGQRALAIYDRTAGREDVGGRSTAPIGRFGANKHGLLDVAGNVWEWTDTCFVRSALGARGQVISTVTNCGVRVVEGRHRTYMSDFVRDARAGGCAGGLPPSNLGFRLVRDNGTLPQRLTFIPIGL